MHPKLHVWLVLRFTVDHEHPIITIICDVVLLDQVAQRDDVGDGLVTVPHIFVVPKHLCFLCHSHCTNITLQSHLVT